MTYTYNLSTKRLRMIDCQVFEANLGNIMSSKTAWATYHNSVPKTQHKEKDEGKGQIVPFRKQFLLLPITPHHCVRRLCVVHAQ